MSVSISSTQPSVDVTTANAAVASTTTSQTASVAKDSLAELGKAVNDIANSTVQGTGDRSQLLQGIVSLVSRVMDFVGTAIGNNKNGIATDSGAEDPNGGAIDSPDNVANNGLPSYLNEGSGDNLIRLPSVPVKPKPPVSPAPIEDVKPPDSSDKPKETNRLEIGKVMQTSKDFLWKPVSDKNGKLVVLLPKRLTGKVKTVTVVTPDAKKVIEKGKSSGVANGDREHFRFKKPGDKYPDGAIVVVTLKDGSKQHLKIKETSKRLVK